MLRELPGRPWAQLFEVKAEEKLHAMEANALQVDRKTKVIN